MIVRQQSLVYLALNGDYRGERLVLRGQSKMDGFTGVILADGPDDSLKYVPSGSLELLDTPGWPDTDGDRFTYELEEYLQQQRGNGSNLLRTVAAAQPRALRKGDVLATGETIVADLRRGFNSSVLICLSETGWVELAPRLPIALQGNERFKLPAELAVGDKLLTECEVVATPTVTELSWINVFLDQVSGCIDTPACIPLALAGE